MKRFGDDKIMDHRRNSEAGSQTDCTQAGSCSDASQPQPQPQPCRGPVQSSCPGSPDDPEKMYVLRNCDRCQDYVVKPCNKCQCPSRGTPCSGRCRQFSKTSLSQRRKKPKPPKETPDRRVGGTCPLCQVCGKEEVQDPGQNMCPHCNQRIHSAVESYYVQCQGQCQQKSQPCSNQQPNGGYWQPLNSGPSGGPTDQPFNIIVLQDGQQQQQVIDQLSQAMNRSGGQMHVAQPPGYNPNNGYNPNSYPSNPLAGYIDYEYLDFNRGYDQERYNYGYDMGPGYSYEDDRYRSPTPCSSYDCPIKNPDYQRPRQDPEEVEEWQDQNQDQGQDQGQEGACKCNCEFCRKGFETREKLAMLIAQALEIFVVGHQASKNQEQKCKKKNKKKKRKKAGKADPKEPWSLVESNHAKPKARPPAGNKPGERPPTHLGFKPESPTTPSHQTKSSTQSNYSRPDSSDSSRGALFRTLHHQPEVDGISTNSEPQFYLPNCVEQRCKNNCRGLCSRPVHDCGKGCLPHCRGPCSKSGAGDGSRKKGKNRKKQGHPDQRHKRCFQCNKEGRQWMEVNPPETATDTDTSPGIDKGCPGCTGEPSQPRSNAGGGKNSSALLGLSPIAHYRPGMMRFPVNYLLAGTNFRRRLVRTAAGVTLHQKPYVDKAEAKDLPSFPCRKESGLLDSPQPPAKKWL